MQSTPVSNAAPTWRLQDAKAQFSALVDNAMRGVPQHVTRRDRAFAGHAQGADDMMMLELQFAHCILPVTPAIAKS